MNSRHKYCRTLFLAALSGLLWVFSSGSRPAYADTISEVMVFMPAGDVGGGVLTPGDIFPPSDDAYGRLKRKNDRLELTILTDGLPVGAYTVWWVVFNNPEECVGGCNVSDLFNPAVGGSVFFSTGLIVEDDGAPGDGLGSALFRDVHYIGSYRGVFGHQDIIPGPNVDSKGAEIHNIIKYHGAPSGDPEVLHDQLTTLLGSCGMDANGFVDPTGTIQCFDPQFVAFLPEKKKGKKGKKKDKKKGKDDD